MYFQLLFFRALIFLAVLLLTLPVYGQFKLSVGQTSYLTKASSEQKLNHYTDIGMSFDKYLYSQDWFYGIQARSLFYVDGSNQNYISIPDLFVGYEFNRDQYYFNVVLGRQKRSKTFLYQKNKRESDKSLTIQPEPWSFMDEIWLLGLWQGQIQWDLLSIEEQGLVGSFFTVQKNDFSLTVFLSGLFIPNSTNVVKISPKGELYSNSRWFAPLSSNFVAFNRRIEALYWIKKPYLKNILLNDSIALRLRFGDMNKQWFSMAYAYKPINQTYFKIDSKFAINKTAIDNFIHYHAFKHSLVSMDVGMKNAFLTSVLSVTQEIPSTLKVPEDWIAPVLPQVLFLSAYFQLSLKQYPLLLDNLEFQLLYSKFFQKMKRTERTNQLRLNLTANRFKMHEGFALSATTQKLRWKNQALSLKTGYWYSFDVQGGWLHAELKWNISSHLSLFAGVDILGTEDNKKESFFNTYKQNDRIIVRAAYAIR